MHKIWIVALAGLLVVGPARSAEFDPSTCGTAKDIPPDAVYVPERPPVDDEGRSTPLAGIDADGDGRDDAVVLWRSYSESRFPADYEQVVYTPSGSGQSYEASFPRIAVLRRGDSYYVQGLTYDSPELSKPAMMQVDVLKLGKSGVVAVCTSKRTWNGVD